MSIHAYLPVYLVCKTRSGIWPQFCRRKGSLRVASTNITTQTFRSSGNSRPYCWSGPTYARSSRSRAVLRAGSEA